MKKLALVFVIAVLVPSLILAWLAFRSLRDQQFVLERQQSLIYQGIADSLARQAQDLLASEQQQFAAHVEALLGRRPLSQVTSVFDAEVRTNWPLAQIGFVVTLRGEILAPLPGSRPEARLFCAVNSSFLGNVAPAEVYWNNSKSLNSFSANQSQAGSQETSGKKISTKDSPLRNVIPQQANQALQQVQSAQIPEQPYSKIAPAETEFRQIVGDSREGILARFLENKLNLLLWYRPAQHSNVIFGAQIDLQRLTKNLQKFLQLEAPLRDEICVALLNDSAKPVAKSRSDFTANWKRPFVATEIGEELPHWEFAVYLLNPDKLNRSAQTLRLTLSLLIAVLLLAIGFGGWLIVADINRQLALARQKTDFVSNVSHELKTPLTSIRMFSELLAEGRVSDAAKQKSYLQIISAEASRLTRLINNVLDFARMERGEKTYHFRQCDLLEILRETAATFRPHLEENGFRFESEFQNAPVWVKCDHDGLAQVIMNLLSNAEKYAGAKKEILVRAESDGSAVAVKVLDRGPGIPKGSEEKIFEQFFRAHDALSSGIEGSGLGLTLARQIARAHGGDLVYETREGGGSCFNLRIPLSAG